MATFELALLLEGDEVQEIPSLTTRFTSVLSKNYVILPPSPSKSQENLAQPHPLCILYGTAF